MSICFLSAPRSHVRNEATSLVMGPTPVWVTKAVRVGPRLCKGSQSWTLVDVQSFGTYSSANQNVTRIFVARTPGNRTTTSFPTICRTSTYRRISLSASTKSFSVAGYLVWLDGRGTGAGPFACWWRDHLAINWPRLLDLQAAFSSLVWARACLTRTVEHPDRLATVSGLLRVSSPASGCVVRSWRGDEDGFQTRVCAGGAIGIAILGEAEEGARDDGLGRRRDAIDLVEAALLA